MRKIIRGISVAIALCLAFTMSLCGCDSGPTPTETVDTFLTAVKAGDEDTVKAVYAGKSFDVLSVLDEEENSEESVVEDDALLDNLVLKMLDFDYELSNEIIDGDKATVDVKITTYDLGTAMTSFFTEYLTQAFALAFSDASDEQLDNLADTLFENEMNKLTEKTYSETVTLDLTKEDDTWKVNEIGDDNEFWNAISGNMVKAMEQLEDVFDEE